MLDALQQAPADSRIERKPMRLAIAAPDGMGIRNFLSGRFLDHIPDSALILHDCPNHDFLCDVNGTHQVKAHRLVVAGTDRSVSLLRQALSYAHLYWADTQAMRFMRQRGLNGSWRSRASISAAKLVGRIGASETGIRLLQSTYIKAHQSAPELQFYMDLFRREDIDVLFCTNQRSSLIMLPVLAAKALGIPTVAYVGSWDNLTSKSRIVAPFDHFLVWSRHMQDELRRYYPNIEESRIHVVGAPQFDFYADRELLWSKKEFCRRIGASEERPLICYSGGDLSTCPEDQEHVRVLMKLIRANRIEHNPQVILRPCPVDDGSRFDHVRQEYPELIYSPPAWRHLEAGNWARCIPTREDIQLLTNLAHHANMGINIASTMTLDFGIHDKPVVNIGYDLSDPPPMKEPLPKLFYTWEHYRPVVELKAASLARSPQELALQVNRYLDNPQEDREGRRALVDMQLGVPVGDSSRRVADALAKVALA